MAITYITQLMVNGSGMYQFHVNGTANITGALRVGAYTLPTADGSAGQVLCTNGSGTVAWGVGGGSSMWADGDAPYIVPCNSCGICTAANIVADCILPISDGNLGAPASPGEWYIGYIQCISASSGVSIYNSAGQVAEFGTSCTCLATIRTKDIHAYSNGGCCIGLTSCRFGEGFINCMFACRILKIPVGTNCY